MSDRDELQAACPALGRAVPRLPLGELPTPLYSTALEHAGGKQPLTIKQDNRSAHLYGGNKVRKLEYLLARALQRERKVIATFGTTGSHHALATALYARQQGLDAIAFLSPQTRTQSVAAALNMHLSIGTRLVPFGGRRSERIATLRRELKGRRAAVIPAGGSSWLGTLGFVNAALELATQIGRGECALPDRLYVATGTMGTAVGLAIGFALAELPIEVHAIRISARPICNDDKLRMHAEKTVTMMRRLDSSIPESLGARLRLELRHEFFGGGYAQTDAATEQAIRIARRDLNLQLEATYTGKAMAALLADLKSSKTDGMTLLFWQTYHAAPLPVDADRPLDLARLPPEFRRYFS